MQATLRLQQRAVSASARPHSRRFASRRLVVAVRAHSQHYVDGDEEVLPIWSGRFDAPDPEKLKFHSPKLGGKTLGEELELMQHAFEEEEKDKMDDMHKHLYSANWQGDVYVGSRWNMLTLLMGLTFFVPVAGLLFAFLSYGTLWTGHYYGI